MIGASLFLHNTLGHDRTADYILHPVQSQSRDSIDEKVKTARKHRDERIVIIDYQYSPHADLVIDHHYSKALGDKFVKNDKLIYDPKAQSCVQVVYDHIQNYKCTTSASDNGMVDLTSDIMKAVKISNMIDTAKYPDRNFFFNSEEPTMILNHYISSQPFNENVYNRIVELLWRNCLDIERVLYCLNVNTPSILFKVRKSAKELSKYMTKVGDISISYLKRRNQYPRYSEFYLNNDIRYTIRVWPVGDNRFQVECGYNEWHEKANPFNIGNFASEQHFQGFVISGGGHFNIGACIIINNKVDAYIDELTKTINLNNKDGSMTMEKYGVSPDDPVEKKADELVKTGQQKNKTDAREEVLKNDSRNKSSK